VRWVGPSVALVLAGCPGPSLDSSTERECEWESPCWPDGTIQVQRERSLPDPVTIAAGPEIIEVGDLTGSGIPQIYVGTTHTVTRLDGADWGVATEIWRQPGDGTYVHPVVADVTGDGLADLIVGLPGSDDDAGQVVIFEGPVREPVSWATPNIQLKGAEGLQAGATVAAAELNRDGVLDLIVKGDGVAWVRFGPITEGGSLGSEGDATFTHAVGRLMGSHVGSDLTGDGVVDLALTVEAEDRSSCETLNEWELRVVPGPLAPGRFDADDAPIHVVPPDYASSLVFGSLDDHDGDGVGDLLYLGVDISHPWIWWPVHTLYRGPFTSDSVPDLRFSGFGIPTALADFDGDGSLDLFQLGLVGIVGGPLEDRPVRYDGDCVLQLDELWGGSAQYLQTDPRAWVGDLDQDGRPDVVYTDRQDSESGLAWVVLSSAE